MKREIAERWADALESGEYVQGREYLSSVDGEFCCLGVLCEIAFQDDVLLKAEGAYYDYVAYGSKVDFEEDHSTTFLPNAAVAWAGLTEGYEDVYFDVTHVQDKLDMSKITKYERDGDRVVVAASVLNDTHGFTFADIAALIRDGKVTRPPFHGFV